MSPSTPHRLVSILSLVLASLIPSGACRSPGDERAAPPGDSAASGPEDASAPRSSGSPTKRHADGRLGFSIELPEGWIARESEPSLPAPPTPRPVASIAFLSPSRAASDLGEAEIPDLSLRLFEMAPGRALARWLVDSGLASEQGAGSSRAYRNGAVEGLEVCSAELAGPGCAVYLAAGRFVYELTPASLEGEAALGTFRADG